MARLALLFVPLAALVCSVYCQDDRSSWDLAKYEEEYSRLYEKCDNKDNPSLISWSEAETALFLLMAVVVVLLLLFSIVLINYCAEKSKKKKMAEDKKHIIEAERY